MASKVTYKLNLLDAFDRAYSGESIEVRSQLKTLVSDPGVKESIGREVIRKIAENTQDNKDKNGKSMGRYSKAYINSTIFKIFKSGQTRVNLTLTGEMLSSMQSSYRPSGYNILFDFVDKLNNDKAHGQIFKNNYNFFGLPKEDEENIVRTIINDAADSGLLEFIDLLTGTTTLDATIGDQVLSLDIGDFNDDQ